MVLCTQEYVVRKCKVYPKRDGVHCQKYTSFSAMYFFKETTSNIFLFKMSTEVPLMFLNNKYIII